MLFGAESYTTVRWIGNESGFANEETWAKSKIDREANTIDSNSIGSYTVGYSDGNQWTVPEADARITSGWFWGASKSTPKTLEELGEMYFRSVGHNATLLLNVPPNNQGKVDEAILERVAEFGREIEKTFQTNYAADTQAVVSVNAVRGNSRTFSPDHLTDGDDATYWTVDDGEQTGVVEIDLGRTRQIDVVSIEESIEFGQRITGFSVEYSNEGGAWESFDEGTTIGAKRLCRRTPVKADKVRITVTGTTGGVPMLSEVGVYKASDGFETASAIPESLVVVDNTDQDVSDGHGFTYTGWTQETFDNMIGGTGMWANPGAQLTLTFRGTKAWLFGTVDPNHGTADIYLDGSDQAETIDTYAASRKVNQVIYTTPDLDYGTHTLRLVTRNKATGIQAAAVLDNNAQGMFEIEEADYLVTEGVDDEVSITIRRLGGSSGEVKVDFQVNPGSAMQADFSGEIAHHLRKLIHLDKEKSILVVGLGNKSITSDSLGPQTVDNLHITRHIIREYGVQAMGEEYLHRISGIIPGVMAQTGMETLEIIQGIVAETQPDVVIAIDALAARSTRRLNRTIQITDTGIHPGSGVGNHREGLTEENLQVKVIGIGVPTVVDAATIVHDAMAHLLEALDEAEQKEFLEELISPNLHSMFVTPKDVDETVKRLSFTISEGLNMAFARV